MWITGRIFRCLLLVFWSIAITGISSTVAFAQAKARIKEPVILPSTDPETRKRAAIAFRDGNFNDALPLYLSLQKGDTNNTDFAYRVAMCYLNMNADHTKAIPFLRTIVDRKDAPADTYLRLGYALHYANRFDEALAAYVLFKESIKGKPDEYYEVVRQIEMCNNAKELFRHPKDVEFEHLGKSVNTPYQDYNPFVTADESFLVFSTRRPGANGGADEFGILGADIYFTVQKNGAWVKSKSIGPQINTALDEEVIGLKQDGRELLIYSNGDEKGLSELYSSKLTGKAFGKMKPYPACINGPDLETGASVSLDGRTLYFSSERNGVGGRDLFQSKALPDGGWSPAINLGKVINTAYDEDAPSISADGKTLYFSSKGHNSMGGFDIFKSEFDDASGTWSTPQNLGCPINTADDNLYFTISENGKYAYVSALRPEGFGDLDIYKVKFKDVQIQIAQTVIKGTVLDMDSILKPVQISLLQNKDAHVIGLYTPKAQTGKFVISVGPGSYTLRVEAEGYTTIEENILISEDNQEPVLTKVIKLIKETH